MLHSKTFKLMILAGASLLPIGVAHAQERPSVTPQNPPADAGEIIVTAQKRAESAQNTPLAITALGGSDLAQRQITSFESLAPSLPSVNFGTNVGFARIAIRGLGLDATVGGSEGRVAYHTDGVYISRPSAQLGTFFDINRVEVIEGPQGTLYGRNATAGAVNVITNDPESTFGGYVKAAVGNYNLVQEEGAITGGLADGVSARLAFTKTDRGGYGKDLATGQDIDNQHPVGIRGKLKLEPSNSVKIVLSGDYSHEGDAAFVYHYIGQGNPASAPRVVGLGGTVPASPRDTYSNIPQNDRREFWGLSATTTAGIGAVNLTSITAYRSSTADVRGDHDGTQIDVSTIRTFEKAKQFSEELRLDGDFGNLKWLVGGFYFHEKIYAESDFGPVLAFSNSYLSQGLHFNGNLGTDALAAFGQFDYEIADGLTISAGLRYSYEKKSIDQRGAIELSTPYVAGLAPNYTSFQNASATFHSTTPRFNIQWKPARGLMLYATYAQGFKSGGFNLTSFGPAVQPEQLKDYEGGFKLSLLDGHLRLNGAVFDYDYKDLQVQRILNAGAVYVNAASARVRGAEVDVVIRPVARIELSGNASYLDAKFTDFQTADSARPTLGILDLSGNTLPQAPKYTVNLAAQYTLPVKTGSVRFRGEMAYTSLVYFSFYNRPEVSQPGYAKFNASINYEGDNGLTASIWMKNIADKRTFSTNQVSSGFLGYPIMGTFDPPRTFGASLGYRF